MTLLHEPLLTRELSWEHFQPIPSSTYIHATGDESRSQVDPQWRARALRAEVRFVEVSVQTRDSMVISSLAFGIFDTEYSLRDQTSLRSLLSSFDGPVYLDITGLAHSTWAPLLSAAVISSRQIYGVYVEPLEYKQSSTPSPSLLYDLSERIEGIAPLPGFASFARPALSEDGYLVPMLGFEGARLAHVLSEVDPPDDRIVPIVGVPGFRPEFPFYAYAGNQATLKERWTASANVRYVKANCPFDLFHELFRITRDYGAEFLRLAPIGTKPHGLGAVLFALSRPRAVELIYDHPVRKAARTVGVARVCLYNIGFFLESDLYLRRGDYDFPARAAN